MSTLDDLYAQRDALIAQYFGAIRGVSQIPPGSQLTTLGPGATTPSPVGFPYLGAGAAPSSAAAPSSPSTSSRLNDLYTQQNQAWTNYLNLSRGLTRLPPGSQFAGMFQSTPGGAPSEAAPGIGTMTIDSGGLTPAGQYLTTAGLSKLGSALLPSFQGGVGLAPGTTSLLGSEALAKAYPGLANLSANFQAGGFPGALFGTQAVAPGLPAGATEGVIGPALETAPTTGLLGQGGTLWPQWLSNWFSNPFGATGPPAAAAVSAPALASGFPAVGTSIPTAASAGALTAPAFAATSGALATGAGATAAELAAAAAAGTAAEAGAGVAGATGLLGALGPLAGALAFPFAAKAFMDFATQYGPEIGLGQADRPPTPNQRHTQQLVAARAGLNDWLPTATSLDQVAQGASRTVGYNYTGQDFLTKPETLTKTLRAFADPGWTPDAFETITSLIANLVRVDPAHQDHYLNTVDDWFTDTIQPWYSKDPATRAAHVGEGADVEGWMAPRTAYSDYVKQYLAEWEQLQRPGWHDPSESLGGFYAFPLSPDQFGQYRAARIANEQGISLYH